MKRVWLAAVAVIVVLVGAALSGPTPSRTEQPAAPAAVQMRVELQQGRVDEVRHTVQIAMNNDGPAKITVVQVELQAPSFKGGAGPVTVDAPLPVGGLRVDVPVSYGTGICTGDDLKPRSAASHVAFKVRTEDGQVHALRLPLASPNAMLDKLLAIDCQQAYLDRQATFTFGPWTPLPSGWVTGTVVVKRVGFPGTITLQEFTGSILLEVMPIPLREATPKPYGVLKPGEDELRIPIIVDGERCTPHALAEIKKPYVFPAFVSLDGGDPLYTELKITDVEVAAFKPVIDACAAGYTQM
ncbi:hypothetical protein KZZ52_48805 [Dactylosporangium sp. AC04546]|uniref:hypothetical protein n=1 Tax=Dactylosporangium sp. AC04546 TaxID=2862460 RepID=UPI001EDE07FE|nr:hypothetical protein [Dactylosporangium sp. AC04546]WVK81792.1 hypothetical protein KZZ52_48805 [Dactylosporangium sp. AC04546]